MAVRSGQLLQGVFGSFLAVGFRHGIIMVWKTTEDWTCLMAINDFENDYEVDWMEFSPVSQRLFIAVNYIVKVWDVIKDWALV